MFNFCLKCKELWNKYDYLVNLPKDKADAVFDPEILEDAPEHWGTNPGYSQVFKESMQEVLLGSVKDFDRQIAIVKIMEKVNQCQGNGYDYRVFYAEDGRPGVIMYMTPYQMRQFLLYGDVSSLDWQLKRKNTYGLVFCGPVGMNTNKKLVHFAHSLMITELLGFTAFLLKTISKISG